MGGNKRAVTPLERAEAMVDASGDTPWSAPSRFGRFGLVARRLLQRTLRPYTIRQREVDRALLQAIRARPVAVAPAQPAPDADGAGRPRIELARLLPEDVIAADTDVGNLLLDVRDTLITPLLVRHSHWEADVAAFLRNRLGAGMAFADVGAHVGYFSILGSSIVGDAGRVFAVEPEPRNLEILRANLWRHACDNVTVLPVAAYESRGHVRFVSNPEGLAGSSIEAEHGEGATMVPCATLDELLGPTQIEVMKVDIERSEPQAIRGAERLIRSARSLDVVAEFWPTHMYATDRSPADVLAYYQSLGFELRLLRPDGSTITATIGEVLAKGDDGPIMNIVLRKR